MNYDIYQYSDLMAAFSGAQVGEEMIINVHADIVFPSQIVVDKALTATFLATSDPITFTATLSGQAHLSFVNADVAVATNIHFGPGFHFVGAANSGGLEISANSGSLSFIGGAFLDCQLNGALRVTSTGSDLIEVSLSDSTFTNNVSASSAITGVNVNLQIDNLVFANNISTIASGGALHITTTNDHTPSLVTIINSQFTGNQTTYDEGAGGAIYAFDTILYVNSSTFNDNLASVNGGAVHQDYLRISADIAPLTLIGCQFTANTSAGHGGALFSRNSSSLIATIADTLFQGNVLTGTQQNLGMAALIMGGDVNISNCQFLDHLGESKMGTLYGVGSRLVMSSCLFRNNSCWHGSAIYYHNWQGDATIDDSIFDNNNTVVGGTVFVQSATKMTITKSAFTNNTCGQAGGAIFNTGVPLSLEECELSGNYSGMYGGAIYSSFMTDIFIDTITPGATRFSNNSAPTYAFVSLGDDPASDWMRAQIHTTHFSSLDLGDLQLPFPTIFNNYDFNIMTEIMDAVRVSLINNDGGQVLTSYLLTSVAGQTIEVIPPSNIVIGGVKYRLSPSDQPTHTVIVSPLEVYMFDYTYDQVIPVTVREFFHDDKGRALRKPRIGSYELERIVLRHPLVCGYRYLGYRVNGGPLMQSDVILSGLTDDTNVTHYYQRGLTRFCPRCK